jgi:hypothetical protein
MSLSNHFALIIGIGNYLSPGFSNLPVTIKDAEAIANILTSPSCGFLAENVTLLTGEQANRASILLALNSIAQKTGTDSVVFIYFSGHGGRIWNGSGWASYLCPRESDVDILEQTAISDTVFSQNIANLKASKVVVVLDSCHSGGVVELKAAHGKATWKVGFSEEYYERLSQGSGRVVIASSRSEQFSYYDPDKYPLSIFTHHFILALAGKAAVRNDGYVHILDIFHSVNEDVQADEPRQTPILRVKDLDMNFPLALSSKGKNANLATDSLPITGLREALIANPLKGAAHLSKALASNPDWLARRDEVDLKRAELERIQHELEIFGPNDNDHAAKNRIVYFLLRTCLWLEEQKAR